MTRWGPVFGLVLFGALAKAQEPDPLPPRVTIAQPAAGARLDQGQSVRLSATARDPDGEDGGLVYVWRSDKDGVLGREATLSIDSLSAGAHTLTVEVSDVSGLVTRKTVQVRVNAAPSAPTVTLSGSLGSDALKASVSGGDDPDGDELSYRYRWKLDGKDAGISGAEVPASRTRKGQRWEVTVRAHDGRVAGPPARASVVIANSVPSLSGVTVSPSRARTTSSLRCSAQGAHDPDGDALTLHYSWKAGGKLLGSKSTLPSSATHKGQQLVCEVSVSDGEGSSSPRRSQPVPIQNTLPGVESASLQPSKATTDTALKCVPGEAKDVDGDSVVFQYRWNVGGKKLSADGPTLPASAQAKGQLVRCSVVPSDGEADGAEVRSNAVTIRNSPPSGGVVSVTPAAPTTSDALACSVTPGSDPDGDKLSYSLAWELDGKVVGSGATLSASVTRKGRSYLCRATPSDGSARGEPVRSAPVQVQNSAPTLSAAAIGPSKAATDTPLSCAALGAKDPDGDKLSYSYSWKAGGQTLGTSPRLAADKTAKGQAVRCEVSATDGQLSSPVVVSKPVTVTNTRPRLASASLGPSDATTDTPLTCAAGDTSDLDGDSVQVSARWSVAGKVLDTHAASLGPSQFKKGQQVGCTLVPNDGEADGAGVKARAITIRNSPPSAGSVQISPSTPSTTDPLRCSASEGSDPDGDRVSYAYSWRRDGSNVGSGATLSASVTRKGGSYSCVATPSDGSLRGEPAKSAAVSVRNSAPTVASASITPSRAKTDTTLSCAVSGAKDADSDKLSYSYSWKAGGKQIGSGRQLPAANTRKGQVVTCEASASDGEASSELVVSKPVTIANTRPRLASATLGPTDATTNTPLSCTAGESSDLDADAVKVAVRWTLDGKPLTLSGDTLPASKTRKGQRVGCSLVPNDGESDGAAVVATTVRVRNSPPQAGSARISPANPVTTDALSCSAAEGSDPDGDRVSYAYSWKRDGKAVGSGATLSAAITRKGASYVCVATPSDGSARGEPVLSAPVSVQNSPPTVAKALISPANVRTTTELRCAASAARDPDGDKLTLSYSWKAGGKVLGTGATLPAAKTSKGQAIHCEITASDGSAQSEPVASKAVSIVNTLPKLASASLGPKTATADSALRCEAGEASDADGDSVALSYVWTVAGKTVPATGATLSSEHFRKGQAVSCRVQPADDQAKGAAVSSASVTIRNTPPSLSGATLGPAGASTSSTLRCSPGTTDDLDGDKVSVFYKWRVDGKAVAATGASLSSSNFRKGQQVVCEATPSDGAARGEPVRSAPLTILNSPPTLVSATVSPNAPRTSRPLDCVTSGARDPDGDEVTLGVSWLVDGKPAASGRQLPATAFRKGQQVVCRAIPSDGAADGEAVSSKAVSIRNTPPKLAAASLGPVEATTNDSLRCGPGEVSDDDGDKVNLSYRWTVNGAQVKASGAALSAEHFRKGQRVACAVVPNDGEVDGTPVRAPAVTIRNTPPRLAGATVTPSEPSNGTTLKCVPGEAQDADNDSVRFSYQWSVDGTTSAGGASFSGASLRHGQAVSCIATPSDGVAKGSPARSAPVTVKNSPPRLSSVSLGPTSATVDSELVCKPGRASDPDHDEVQFSYAWSVGERRLAVKSATLAGAFSRSDKLRCHATPSDGTAQGEERSSNVITIRNRAPKLTEVVLGPEGARTTDPIVAKVTSVDPDGDTVELSWRWTVAGRTVDNDGPRLPADKTRKGARVQVTVTPSDGLSRGSALRSAVLTVANTPPTAPTVRILDPKTGAKDLLCLLEHDAQDADGDAVSYAVEWSVDGERFTGESRTVLISGDSAPWESLKTDQVWSCAMRASDGSEQSPAATAETTVVRPAIGVGSGHSCAMDAAGTVRCWGLDTQGQSRVPYSLSFRRLVANGWHSCGITLEHRVRCWGHNNHGQRDAPAGKFIEAAAGAWHSCGIDLNTRSVSCWGLDDAGQASPPAGPFKRLAAGTLHTCGINAGGALMCWGSNESGQQAAPAGRYVEVSAGDQHSCALTDGGAVRCWGLDDYGQSRPPEGSFRSITAGGTHSCALRADGTAVCWGDNEYGQATPPEGAVFTALQAGNYHTCGWSVAGKVQCWGRNNYGQTDVPKAFAE